MPEAPSPPSPASTDDEAPTERDELLGLLADTTRDLHAEIEAADPDGPDAEALQLRRIRTLGYLVGQYRKLMKDTDIDEMQDELALLEKATGRGDER